jgi:hypothetical protein
MARLSRRRRRRLPSRVAAPVGSTNTSPLLNRKCGRAARIEFGYGAAFHAAPFGMRQRTTEKTHRLNKRFGKDFRVLKGIESGVLADGSLDYPDEVLDRFDSWSPAPSACCGPLPTRTRPSSAT